MFGRRKRRLREAEARVDQLLALRREEQRNTASAIGTERHAKRVACRQVEALLAAVTRVDGRNAELRQRLAARGDDVEAEYLVRLEARVERLQHGCARWMAAVWDERATVRRLRRQVEDVRRPYEARLAELTAANQALNDQLAAAEARPHPDEVSA